MKKFFFLLLLAAAACQTPAKKDTSQKDAEAVNNDSSAQVVVDTQTDPLDLSLLQGDWQPGAGNRYKLAYRINSDNTFRLEDIDGRLFYLGKYTRSGDTLILTVEEMEKANTPTPLKGYRQKLALQKGSLLLLSDQEPGKAEEVLTPPDRFSKVK